MALSREHVGGLEQRFRTAFEASGIPGAVCAIAWGGERASFAAGVVNVETGVATTTDSAFQIGSITKLYVATMVMQLIEERLLEIDEPVQTYLPGFVTSDLASSKAITVRHLLNHTGGFEGDFDGDFGRGDDALAQYTDALGHARQYYPPGTVMSYSNSGYAVLGRIVEVLRNEPSWISVFNRRLAAPLAMTRTAVRPEDALRFRASHGHVQGENGTAILAPRWHGSWALAAAGSAMAASVEDVLSFALTHIHALGGVRSPVISTRSAQLMVDSTVAQPGIRPSANRRGLGWEVEDRLAYRVLGHGGQTIGNEAYLKVVPELELAVVLLANASFGLEGLFDAVIRQTLGDTVGLDLGTPSASYRRLHADEMAKVAGTYHSAARTIKVEADPHTDCHKIELRRHEAIDVELGVDAPERYALRIYDDRIIGVDTFGAAQLRLAIPDLRQPVPYLWLGNRALARIPLAKATVPRSYRATAQADVAPSPDT